MRTLRLSTGAAALAVSSLALFGMAGPSLAQQGGGNGQGNGQGNNGNNGNKGENCPNPAGKYPPGQCKKKGVSNSNPGRGQQMTASTDSGSFDPGSGGEFGVESTYLRLGGFTADSTGAATVSFPVPASLANGPHDVVFKGLLNGQPNVVRVGFTVTGSDTAVLGVSADRAAGAAQGTPSSLPFTGSGDLIPLTVVGVGMVALGAGVVVAARRRRSELDVSNVA